MNSFVIVLLICCFVSSKTTTTDTCSSSPCRGGDCEETSSGYECHCYEGVKGVNCERRLTATDSVCLRNPCWGGGTCVADGDMFKCLCTADRTGEDCRTFRNISTGIQTKPECYNGATATPTGCQCAPSFTGVSCTTTIKPSTIATVKVFNKGWFTAKIYLNYSYNSVYYLKKATLLARQRYTFTYNRTSGRTEFSIDAQAGKKQFYVDSIVPKNETNVCYHVWGSVFKPKSSRMPCW